MDNIEIFEYPEDTLKSLENLDELKNGLEEGEENE